MTLLVDTSVWSLALRRDATDADSAPVLALRRALQGDDLVVTTGLIVQELLQGVAGPKARDQIIERFGRLPLVTPDLQDHMSAADLRNTCRRSGVQLGTIDALIAQLCIRHRLLLLTTDLDFSYAARHCPLQLAPLG